MSRVDDLIQERCPTGVSFKPLKSVVERISNIQWAENGHEEFKYIDLTSVDRLTRSITGVETITWESAPSRAQQVVRKGDVIFGTTRPMLKRYCLVPAEYDGQIASTGYCVLRASSDRLIPNFLFHLLGTPAFYDFVEANQRGASYPAIPNTVVKDFRIPVPPLTVQREIVRVLDQFTQLEAELEAELEARRRQYEHYHRDLFNFNGDVPRLQLADICESISAGGDLPRRFAKGQTVPSLEFPFPIFSNGTGEAALYGFTDSYKIAKQAVTISARGTIGFHTIRAPKFTHIVRLLALVPDPQIMNIRFLNYVLDASEIGHSGGSIPQLTVPAVKKIKVPVPTLQEQERIVDILDNFDALVNDFSKGLPAELAARRKQYEYYRNRLLTFEEAPA